MLKKIVCLSLVFLMSNMYAMGPGDDECPFPPSYEIKVESSSASEDLSTRPIKKHKFSCLNSKCSLQTINVVVAEPTQHTTYHKDYTSQYYPYISYIVRPGETVANLKYLLKFGNYLPNTTDPIYALGITADIFEVTDNESMQKVANKALLLSIYPDIYGLS